MAEDLRKTLKAAGWYHDAANSGPGCAVWKYNDGRGEMQVDGQLVDYMEGETEVLSRVAATLGLDSAQFASKDPRAWTTWGRPAGGSTAEGGTHSHAI